MIYETKFYVGQGVWVFLNAHTPSFCRIKEIVISHKLARVDYAKKGVVELVTGPAEISYKLDSYRAIFKSDTEVEPNDTFKESELFADIDACSTFIGQALERLSKDKLPIEKRLQYASFI